MTKNKYNVGDLVKPNEKAYKRNAEFSSDRRFVVSSVQSRTFEDELWYGLCRKDDFTEHYILPENEIDLVKAFVWEF